MSLTLANRPPIYRAFYLCCLGGFALLWLTYLIRPNMPDATGTLALVLGFLPSLGGAFGTPYLLAMVLSEWKKQPEILRNARAFLLICLFVMAMCVLIEYAHQIFELGGFHAHDITASLAGTATAILVHTYIIKSKKI